MHDAKCIHQHVARIQVKFKTDRRTHLYGEVYTGNLGNIIYRTCNISTDYTKFQEEFKYFKKKIKKIRYPLCETVKHKT